MNTNRSDVTKLTDFSSDGRYPVWSPTGNLKAAASISGIFNGGIAVIDLALKARFEKNMNRHNGLE